MMSKRAKQIICIALAVIIALSLIIPVFAEENTTSTQHDNEDGTTTTVTETQKEEYDEETNTKTKEVTVDIKVKTDEEQEPQEKPKGEFDTDDPVKPYEAINEPGREATAYDNYVDFDALMQDKRGSTYYFDGKNEYDVVVAEGGAQVKFVIHHMTTGNNGEPDKYFVYDENEKKLSSSVRYTPEEMEVTVYNVPKGQKIHIDAYFKNPLDGVFITQKSEGEYKKGQGPLASVYELYGHFNSEEEVHRSLLYADDITVEDLDYLLKTYPSVPANSLLKEDGVAEAFIRAQNEFGVSALGLLAIGCLESAWGTSRIARNKHNLFGWGAVDSNPYNGAWDWSGNATSEAIYNALCLICKNYSCGKYGQDSFYKMRYNVVGGKPTHQYCTSTTWPYSNTMIRAQFEQYLGLR